MDNQKVTEAGEEVKAHTPGPWSIEWMGGGRPAAIRAANNTTDFICGIGAGISHIVPEAVANARLIAAAPDLKDGIKSLLAAINDWRENGKPDYVLLLAATNKAEQILSRAEGK